MHAAHFKYAASLFHNISGPTTLNVTRISTLETLKTSTYPEQTYPTFKGAQTLPTLWNKAGPAKFHRNPTKFKICLKEELPQPNPTHPTIPRTLRTRKIRYELGKFP
jgi:hypothetical protein